MLNTLFRTMSLLNMYKESDFFLIKSALKICLYGTMNLLKMYTHLIGTFIDFITYILAAEIFSMD